MTWHAPLVWWTCLCAWSSTQHWACAGEEEHRQSVQRALWVSQHSVNTPPVVFVSEFYVQREMGHFTQSSGATLLSVPATVTSVYDPSTAHAMAGFYESQKVRKRWVLNYLDTRSHWVFSLGHDSGLVAPKLSVSPALFVGLAKSFVWQKGQRLGVSWGRWFGGRVTERPCQDAYDREYWCPNLSEWQQRPVLDHPVLQYYELKYQWLFD